MPQAHISSVHRPRLRRVSVGAAVALGIAAGGVLGLGTPAHAGTTFRVTSTNDRPDANPGDGRCASSSGSCTLRAAVQEANATPGPDDIELQSARYTLGQVNGTAVPSADVDPADSFADLDITDDVRIYGNGAGATIVDGGDRWSVFHIGGAGLSPHVTMFSLTITNGGERDASRFGRGGGINVEAGSTLNLSYAAVTGNRTTLMGSGILNNGSLYLTQVTVSGNTNLSGLGGGGVTATGGGIANGSNGGVVMTSTTVNDNFSLRGGGITNSGWMQLRNSTVSGNSALNTGGGIRNTSTGVLWISWSTVTGNSANSTGAADSGRRGGGGIANIGGFVGIGTTILAGNTDVRGEGTMRSPDCLSESGDVVSHRDNVFGALGASCGVTDVEGGPLRPEFDDAGTLGAPLDAGLDALSNDGSPTSTHALRPGSPAVDSGPSLRGDGWLECPNTDQRGFSRPAGAGCDSGAVELQP